MSQKFTPFQKRIVPKQPWFHEGEARNKTNSWLAVCSEDLLRNNLFFGALVTTASRRKEQKRANMHLQPASFRDPNTMELVPRLVEKKDEFGAVKMEEVPEFIDHQNLWTFTHNHDKTIDTPPILAKPTQKDVIKRLSKRFKPRSWNPDWQGFWQVGEICSVQLDPSRWSRSADGKLAPSHGDIRTLQSYVPGTPDIFCWLPCVVVATDAIDRASGWDTWQHISIVPLVQDSELADDPEIPRIYLPRSRVGVPEFLSAVSTMVMTVSYKPSPSCRVVPGHLSWFTPGFRVPDEAMRMILEDIRHMIGDWDDD